MPGETPKTNTVSRSLGVALGVTEIMYLLGLLSLASGISLQFGIAWALIVTGAALSATSIYNDLTRDKGKQ